VCGEIPKKGMRRDTLLADSYLKRTKNKRKRKLEKERTAKSIPKKYQRRTLNIKGVFPFFHRDSDENSVTWVWWLEVLFSTVCAKGWLEQVATV